MFPFKLTSPDNESRKRVDDTAIAAILPGAEEEDRSDVMVVSFLLKKCEKCSGFWSLVVVPIYLGIL
jgi:hypothetical protein